MILRVCEACERPAPPGDPSRDREAQAAMLYHRADGAPHLPAGWVHLRHALGAAERGTPVQSYPVDLCSPRCLRVWAEAHADDLEEELGIAPAGARDRVAYQHGPGEDVLTVHRARLREADLARVDGEVAPHPHFVRCPACGAAATTPCTDDALRVAPGTGVPR